MKKILFLILINLSVISYHTTLTLPKGQSFQEYTVSFAFGLDSSGIYEGQVILQTVNNFVKLIANEALCFLFLYLLFL